MPESHTHPVINLTQLQAIIGNNPESLKELLPVFRTNIAELLAKLEDSITYDDHAAWRKVAHRMRGVSANFGFPRLQHLCAEAEDAQPLPPLTQMFPPIREAVEEANQAIEETLKTLAG